MDTTLSMLENVLAQVVATAEQQDRDNHVRYFDDLNGQIQLLEKIQAIVQAEMTRSANVIATDSQRVAQRMRQFNR